MVALMALVASGYGRETDRYKQTVKLGYRHGKHNGQTPGAFGGKKAAKGHRTLYVKQANA